MDRCRSDACLRINTTKTYYLPSPSSETRTVVKCFDGEQPIVIFLNYLGSLFTSEGGLEADVTQGK